MRSRMAWAIFVLVVVLIVIALMSFNLTALHEPGPIETRLTNLPPVISFTALADGIPRAPRTPRQALKEAVHTTDSIAAYVTPTMADHNELRACGCIRAHPISPANRYRATPTRSCFGLSRMESASPECRLSGTSRPQTVFGIS